MFEIPTVLRSDEFRQLIRKDRNLDEITHKSTLKKEQRITDGITQLMINTSDKWEKHSDFPFWNWVRLSYEFERNVCLNDISYFQSVLVQNGFQLNRHYQIPNRGKKGKTRAIGVPVEKVKCAIDFLKEKHQELTKPDKGICVDWSAPFDFKGVPLPSKIRIDSSLLKEISAEVLEVSEKLNLEWNLQLRAANALENDGWLEQNYKVSEYGRCFGSGLSSLQTMPKTILKRVLKGCWNLDVNTASFVILTEEHRRRFRNSKFPAIERYIRFKTWIREEVARSIGADSSSVKKGFTAIGFGMRTNTKLFYDLNGNLVTPTLTSTFGGNLETARKFLDHPEVKEFWSEVRVLFDDLSRCSEQELTGLKKGQRVSYLYQHREAEILRSICRSVGENLVIPKHDAVVIQNPIEQQEINWIQKKVEEETGFRITLSEEAL